MWSCLRRTMTRTFPKTSNRETEILEIIHYLWTDASGIKSLNEICYCQVLSMLKMFSIVSTQPLMFRQLKGKTSVQNTVWLFANFHPDDWWTIKRTDRSRDHPNYVIIIGKCMCVSSDSVVLLYYMDLNCQYKSLISFSYNAKRKRFAILLYISRMPLFLMTISSSLLIRLRSRFTWTGQRRYWCPVLEIENVWNDTAHLFVYPSMAINKCARIVCGNAKFLP